MAKKTTGKKEEEAVPGSGTMARLTVADLVVRDLTKVREGLKNCDLNLREVTEHAIAITVELIRAGHYN